MAPVDEVIEAEDCYELFKSSKHVLFLAAEEFKIMKLMRSNTVVLQNIFF